MKFKLTHNSGSIATVETDRPIMELIEDDSKLLVPTGFIILKNGYPVAIEFLKQCLITPVPESNGHYCII